MIAEDKPNPFQVLGLPTNASKKDIVDRGEELYVTAETEEQRLLYRWAKEQLLTNQHIRLLYELFELPDTRYEDLEWEEFVRKYRRNSLHLDALVKDAPPIGLEDFDITALIRLLLQGMFTVPEIDIDDILKRSPFAPRSRPPLEVRDVLFG
jgi:hypothetical protein